MKAHVQIDAGICGFRTEAGAVSEDNQNVTFDVKTHCTKIAQFVKALKMHEPLDAYQEISPNGPATIVTIARETLCGCCMGCIVPGGLFKAMQVAAGLALPKDIHIALAKDE